MFDLLKTQAELLAYKAMRKAQRKLDEDEDDD